MSFDNNVIDFKSRKKVQENEGVKKTDQNAPVVDISERRQEMLQDERRIVKRTILTEFIGAFIVVPQSGLCPVSIYDISEDGLSFDLDYERGRLTLGEEIAMRIYMNKKTYFPFIVKTSNIRDIPEEGVIRHGVSLMKGTINDVALHHFVRFIENVCSCLEKDSGDILVSNLRK